MVRVDQQPTEAGIEILVEAQLAALRQAGLEERERDVEEDQDDDGLHQPAPMAGFKRHCGEKRGQRRHQRPQRAFGGVRRQGPAHRERIDTRLPQVGGQPTAAWRKVPASRRHGQQLQERHRGDQQRNRDPGAAIAIIRELRKQHDRGNGQQRQRKQLQPFVDGSVVLGDAAPQPCGKQQHQQGRQQETAERVDLGHGGCPAMHGDMQKQQGRPLDLPCAM